MEKYLLHINEPCSENWDRMTPTDNGRFCASCQKTVFDFTTATDNEIIEHIEKMKGNMFCGQFEAGQLNRWMEKTNIQTSNPRLYKYLLSFLLLTAGQQVMAQTETTKQENVVQSKKIDSALKVLKSEIPRANCIENIIKDSSDQVMLRGKVNFSKMDPLILINGKIVEQKKFKKLKAKDIDSIDVLKDAKATSIYGSEGKNGVIIITTKNFNKKMKAKTP